MAARAACWAVAVAGAALAAVTVPAESAHAATVLTVTSTDDTSTSCTPTFCTLRDAIIAANVSGGGAVINFSIAPSGPQTITIGPGANNPLPPITGNDVVLNATTQPGGGATGIRLDDPDTGDQETGLVLQGQRITVRGFAITRFDGFGMWLRSTARNDIIAGNRIRTADGMTALGTKDDGIRVQGGGGHRIGGTTAADRNIVSGGGNDGIQLNDSSDNVIAGNYVGMTAGGLSRLPNADSGIQVTSASLRNRVGGSSAAERNVVSGNNGIGIQLLGTMRADGTCASPEQNLVQGNYAGLDINGSKPSPYGNRGAGIELGVCARNNTIGGSAAGNARAGVAVDPQGESTPTGTNRITRNQIRDNGGLGIDLLPVAGINANDGTMSAAVGNNGMDFAVIQAATAASVKGTAPAGAIVEVFLARNTSGETNGEGASYLGTATANSAGTWCLGGLSVTGAVTATATDERGNTSEFAANVAPAGTQALCSAPVSDTFSRVVTDGWGSTDGFPWSTVGTASDYAVDGAVGAIQQRARARGCTLAIGRQNTTVAVRFRFTAVPSASWQAFVLLARVGGAADWYGVRVRSVANAADDIEIDRNTTADGTAKVGTGATTPEFVSGVWYWIRLETQGDGTATTLRARLWPDGTPEPTFWNVTASDSTASLQGTGGVGVRVNNGSGAPLASVEVDDFTASSLG